MQPNSISLQKSQILNAIFSNTFMVGRFDVTFYRLKKSVIWKSRLKSADILKSELENASLDENMFHN